MLTSAHPSKYDLVDKAMAFSIDPVLRRYSKYQELEMSVVREHEKELKRYLVLCSLRPSGTGSYGVRGPVDELWHTFIIFTRLYAEFCEQTAGRFLHHSPTEMKKDPSEAETKYARTLSVYKEFFGEDPPAHIWPLPGGNRSMIPILGADSSSSSSSSDDDAGDDDDGENDSG